MSPASPASAPRSLAKGGSRRRAGRRLVQSGLINPELLRNIWLELTPMRMVGAPLLILTGLALIAVLSGANPKPLEDWTRIGAFLALGVHGIRRASSAVPEEIRLGTWEAQRQVSLSAAALALGKLLGATCFAWYLGIWILAGLGYARSLTSPGPEMLDPVWLMAATCLIGQMVGMTLSIALARKSRFDRRVRIAMAHIGGLAVAVGLMLHLGDRPLPFQSPMLSAILQQTSSLGYLWYGMTLDKEAYRTVILIFASSAAAIGLWRMTAVEILYRPLPWIWPLFCLLLAGFMAGFAPALPLAEPLADLWLPLVGVLIAGYLALFLEVKDTVRTRWLLRHLGQGDLRRAWGLSPLWLGSLLVVILLGAGNGIALLWQPAPAVKLPGVALPVATETAALAGLSLVVYFVRDILLVYAAGLGARKWRSDWTGFAVLMVLYILLPTIAQTLSTLAEKYQLPIADVAARLQAALQQITPMVNFQGDMVPTLALGAIQAALLGLFLRWRWRVHLSTLSRVVKSHA